MSTTFELVDRAVETPISKARRRRFWLMWWLWGIFGTSFSMHGVSDGTWMAVALLLTSPFWVLFCLWPLLWLWDRFRARRLWAEEVVVVWVEASSGETTKAESLAIPVILGCSGIFVPMLGWLPAFPDLDEAFLVENGVRVFEKDAFYGIHVKGVLGEDLCQIFQKYEESRFCKDFECKKDIDLASAWYSELLRLVPIKASK